MTDFGWLQDLNQEAFDRAVAIFLEGNTTTKGALLHWTNIITEGLYFGQRKFGTVEALPFPTKTFEGNMRKLIPTEMAEFMNRIYSSLADPNIEGIPISASSEAVVRETDVSIKPILVPASSNRQYISDNAVPRPRIWSVKGYLTSQWSSDIGFVLKPSLLYQCNLLDAYARSRRPVWYKTSDCEFVKVIITALSIETQPQSSTTKAISVQLSEFIPMNITSNPTGIFTATRV